MPVVTNAKADHMSKPRIAAKAAKTMTKTSKPRLSARKTSSGGGAKAQSDGDVRFTHPDRVYWVDVGVTKQDLADYYRSAWEWMAPHVIDRPLALVRCPEGTKGQCFFQKHASAGLTERNLRTVIDSKGRQIIAVEDLDGLLSLVQAGVLEVHVRGSTIDHLDVCDRIVFDIDPGDGVPWTGVVAAARDVRERLAAIKLESFVKLTGGKGLHVVLPIEPRTSWEDAKKFTQSIAETMAKAQPDRYVAIMSKSARRGRIFIDYIRNGRGATAVAAYSTRALPVASVSTPLAWDELSESIRADHFRIDNLRQRLDVLKDDPWPDFFAIRQRLPQGEKRR
jgi:bifunctional non-homologous end joining protein LigD